MVLKFKKSVSCFYYFLLLCFITGFINYQSFCLAVEKNGDKEQTPFKLTDIVCSYVEKLYVYPDRIKPDKMLIYGLKRIEQSIPELLIDVDDKSGILIIHVDNQSMKLNVNELKTLKDTSEKLKEAFAFIAENKQTEKIEADDIMYDGLNGMLSRLGPHTIVLPPKAFDEFKIGTTGQFGGLGMVVGIREGILAVISPIEGTPAHRAGLKAGDQIFEIDGESTVNMTLSESVSKLRGKPNTIVTISVLKYKATKPELIAIEREIIRIPTVDDKILEDGIGYIKIRNFQNDTSAVLNEHIKNLKKSNNDGKIKGLIIDLRNNSGGLLDQAIKVTDQFIDSGNIVVTVGPGGRNTDVKKAKKSKTDELDFPIVVMINSSSASGAEIVVGALKDNNRCVVIGNRSFGKGSVQQLIDLINGAALKLTMAKYLTPFFNEVQAKGISPDILFRPATISDEDINLFRKHTFLREEDLAKHKDLDYEPEPVKTTALVEIKYLKELEKKEDGETEDEKEPKLEDADPYKAGDLTKDNLVQFAKMIIKKSQSSKRSDLLKDIQPLLKEIEVAEEEKILQAFKGIGIDWTDEKTAEPVVSISELVFEQIRPENETGKKTNKTAKVFAGDKLKLTVSISNKGKGDMFRVRGISESKNIFIDKLEFVFGKIPSGETKSYTKTVEIPKNMIDREDEVKIVFNESNENAPEDLNGIVRINRLNRPKFAYSYQISDKAEEGKTGNNDGLIQKNEDIKMRLFIKNTGKSTAEKTAVSLKNISEEEIFVSKGMAEIEELLPGETKSVDMELKIKEGVSIDKFDLDIIIRESTFGEFILNNVTLFVSESNKKEELKTVASKLKVTQDNAPVLGSRYEGADHITMLRKDTIINSDAMISNSKYRVNLPSDVYGWIPANYVEKSLVKDQKSLDSVDFRLQHIPPSIELDTKNLKLLTDAEMVSITGIVNDNKEVKSVYAFVNSEKIYFKSRFTEIQSKYNSTEADNFENKKASAISNNKNDSGTLPFFANLHLKDGPNTVTIIARDNDNLTTSMSIVITKISTSG